jgi:DNA polymerase III epsilon subunit-like protein
MLEGCILAGHNVGYDADILKANLERTNIPMRRFPWHKLDTVTLAYEHLVPLGVPNLKLTSCCDFIGVRLTEEDAHTAMGDVRATRQLYHALARANAIDRLRWRWRNLRRQFKK